MREGLYIHIDDAAQTAHWATGIDEDEIREKLKERSELYVTPEGSMIRRKQ